MKALASILMISMCFGCLDSSDSDDDQVQIQYRLTTNFTGEDKPLGTESNENGDVSPVLVGSTTLSRWEFDRDSNGLYTIILSDANLALEVVELNADFQVELNSTSGFQSQLWEVAPLPNGTCRVSPFLLGSGQSLDIVNDDEDRRLNISASGDFSGQFWTIEPVTGVSDDDVLSQCSDVEAVSNSGQPTATEEYRAASVSGFNLLIHPTVDESGQLGTDALAELEMQLSIFPTAVPAPILSQLQQVTVWVEHDQETRSSGQFHLSEAWLQANGYNLEKVGAAEISNTQIFLDDAQRLNALTAVHELAHAREHYLGMNSDIDLQSAFEAAKASGKYDSVEYATGTSRQAYAMTNYKEYFAELSEAWFGSNDFYPFNREQLMIFDPAGFALMQQAWEE